MEALVQVRILIAQPEIRGQRTKNRDQKRRIPISVLCSLSPKKEAANANQLGGDKKMEVGTLTATVEEKRAENQPDAPKDGAPKEPAAKETVPVLDAAAKAKDAKPAPDRKPRRNLSEDKRFKLFSGTANRQLSEEVATHIGVKVGEAKLQRFADGEVYFQLLENVRGVDVFVVQPTCYPVDSTWWSYW